MFWKVLSAYGGGGPEVKPEVTRSMWGVVEVKSEVMRSMPRTGGDSGRSKDPQVSGREG